MLFLKYLLTSGGIAMMVIAAGILAYDFYREIRHRQAQAMPEAAPTAAPHIRWRASLALALLAWGPLLIAAGIVVVPSGMAGVRVSQTKGTLPGTLYPGAHFVTPLAENVALFDTRDQLLDRKSTRLNSSHVSISYAVFCLKKKKHDLDRSL